MKKYLLPLSLLLCAFSSQLSARTISASDAQLVALNFFKVTANPATPLTATLKYTKTEADQTVDFYVFDINTSGFVIVSADDNIIPILAYSTKGNFRTDFRRTGLNHWVNKTAANIHLAILNNAVADARIQNQWTAYRQGTNPMAQRSSAVSPLCATTWDQENDISFPPPFIYNLFCPYNVADTQRALTGCVATAMAQIMKYWNYPAQGVGSYSYVDDTINGYSNNYGVQSSNFAAHTYQWSQMPAVLTGSEPLVQDSAISRLMYDCAVSVGMDFGDDKQNGSGSEGLLSYELQYVGDSVCSQTAFVKYFSYDADTIQGVIEANYTPTAWTTLIEHDLNIGRPVFYEGTDTAQGGHAWVCDGYDASDKLHMNWGWGGYDDGYFAINNLTTSGNFNPITEDAALIGILPKHAHSTGIAAVNELSFNIYPNPANGSVVLQSNELSNGAIWTIKNLLGQTLISKTAESAQTRISLDGLSSGVYLVELQQGEISATKKLVISK